MPPPRQQAQYHYEEGKKNVSSLIASTSFHFNSSCLLQLKFFINFRH